MVQNTNELRNKLEKLYNYSDEALQAVHDVLELLDEGDDRDISELVWESLDSTFIYYNDAFEYVKNNGHTDFGDPVREGFETISQIAYFFCEGEVYEIMSEIGLDW